MFRSKIEIFIIKRILIFYFLLTVLAILFVDQKVFVLSGLTVGAGAGLLRFCSTASMLAGYMLRDNPGVTGNGVIRYIVNMVATIALLTVSLIYDKWFFAGTAAGILIVPLAITLNGITEGLGITHNSFE